MVSVCTTTSSKLVTPKKMTVALQLLSRVTYFWELAHVGRQVFRELLQSYF